MQIKDHFKKHKTVYLCAATGVISAGIAVFVTKGVLAHNLNNNVSIIGNHGIALEAKKIVLKNVSYIESNRQGPPSWVVRCKETGDVFTSQQSASNVMEIPKNELSRHLNGLRNDVRGYHFERLCMAV